jgi:UDP-2,3-diacylglucosamine hydrolase
VQVLHQASTRLDLFFMCGNRDFLVGARCLRDAGVQGLDDPCVLALGTTRWLLSHGDAMCLDDIAYQQFRTLVRSPAWQAGFLDQPLSARQATARQLRAQSEQHKRAQPVLVDVDTHAAQQQMQASATSVLIHGHTHQPADHALTDGLRRIVLSDWDLQATPPRAQVLRLQLHPAGEPTDVHRMSPSDAC